MTRIGWRLWDSFVLQRRAEQVERIRAARSLGGRMVGSVVMRRRWESYRLRLGNSLIIGHRDMVERIARQVSQLLLHVPVAELESAGYLGLVEAARRYDRSRGDFARFAYFRVRGAMIDAHKRRSYRDEQAASLDGIRESLTFEPANVFADRHALPDQLVLSQEKRDILTAALAELESGEQHILRRALSGASLDEIGRQYGRSVSWVRTKVAAARDKAAAIVRERYA